MLNVKLFVVAVSHTIQRHFVDRRQHHVSLQYPRHRLLAQQLARALQLLYTVNRKKRGSTFVIITLEYIDGF